MQIDQESTFDSQERLDYLEDVFRATVDGAAADPDRAVLYFKNGGCLRQCLSEIETLAGPSALDLHIAETRNDYMTVATTRPTLRNRLVRKADLLATEASYVDSIIEKIATTIDARSADEILAVRQMPSLVAKSSFQPDQPLVMKDMAANHLYLLLDTALQEHSARRAFIERRRTETLRARIMGSRALHLTVAGGIWAAAYAPEIPFVPTPNEVLTGDIELTLKIISGTIIGIDSPEVARLWYLQRKHDKRTRDLEHQLADDQELTDLALRTVYSSPRYGSSQGPLQISNRFGTHDKHENLRRFHRLEEEFSHLHNDPGGKPYTAEQALGYAARFLIERKAQIDELLVVNDDPDSQREKYLTLCREIITEDLARMKKGLTITRYRKEFMKMIGIVPAALFPSFTATASEARTLSTETNKKLLGAE